MCTDLLTKVRRMPTQKNAYYICQNLLKNVKFYTCEPSVLTKVLIVFYNNTLLNLDKFKFKNTSFFFMGQFKIVTVVNKYLSWKKSNTCCVKLPMLFSIIRYICYFPYDLHNCTRSIQ